MLANGTSEQTNPITLYFSIKDRVGVLDDCLSILKKHSITLTRIESRPSPAEEWDYDFFIDLKKVENLKINKVITDLADITKQVKVLGSEDHSLQHKIPWFPRRLRDLDSYADKVLSMGSELQSDHPGAQDPAYRARREEIARLAREYRTGKPLPRIEYTQQEIETWKNVYESLINLFPTHACREFSYVFPLLVQNCGYGPNSVPQLEEVSQFLKECSGFTLRPVMGLLSSRDFLNGLAFRVFHSTQYIRHSSVPLYTPEPDVCHELLGHVPLFADPDFAEFSQEIGLASLAASDEDIEKLSTIYWFTVEFGLCRQGGEVRAYGAGLLSSFGELEYCLSDKPKKLPFEPAQMAVQKYPITEYQPVYFVAESFQDAKSKVREFASSLNRPFNVRYNPFTQTIEVLDNKDKLIKYTQSIKSDIQNLLTALTKI